MAEDLGVVIFGYGMRRKMKRRTERIVRQQADRRLKRARRKYHIRSSNWPAFDCHYV